MTDNLEKIPMCSEWEGLRTVGIVVSDVTENGKTTTACRYYIWVRLFSNESLNVHIVAGTALSFGIQM
jgi:hypothetical protein